MGDDIGHPQFRYDTYKVKTPISYQAALLWVLGLCIIGIIAITAISAEHPCETYSGAEREQCNEVYETGPEPDYNM